MTQLVDTYFRAQTKEELIALKASLKNVTNPVQGRAATEEYTDDLGNVIPEQPQVGDPNYWYCFARAPFAIPTWNGLEVVDQDLGKELCGE